MRTAAVSAITRTRKAGAMKVYARRFTRPPGKTCGKCGRWKSPDGFCKDKSRKSGLTPYCRLCIAADYASNSEDKCARVMRYYQANREDILRRASERHARDRAVVFGYYGGTCLCCGTVHNLTIDHLDGDGREHRKDLGVRTSWEFYRWLIRNDFPERPRLCVLCHSCNSSKGNSPGCKKHGKTLVPELLALAV